MVSIFKGKGLNLALLVLSLFVLSGSAIAMTGGQKSFKTGASNVTESATGKLVKKGTPAFSPCKNATTEYALIGVNLATPTPACTPLSVKSSEADALVGKSVTVTGTFQDGVFYATTLTKASK